MSDDSRGGNKYLRTALMAGAGIGMLQAPGAYAEGPAAAQSTNQNPQEEFFVFGQSDSYKVDVSGVSKLTSPILDVPQSIETISEQVLQDRAVTNLNDALRSVPGITIGAGEFQIHRQFADHPWIFQPGRTCSWTESATMATTIATHSILSPSRFSKGPRQSCLGGVPRVA